MKRKVKANRPGQSQQLVNTAVMEASVMLRVENVGSFPRLTAVAPYWDSLVYHPRQPGPAWEEHLESGLLLPALPEQLLATNPLPSLGWCWAG